MKERKPETQLEEGMRIETPFITAEDADLLNLTVNWHNALENLSNPKHKRCEAEIRVEDIRTGGMVVPNNEVTVKVSNQNCWNDIQALFREISA